MESAMTHNSTIVNADAWNAFSSQLYTELIDSARTSEAPESVEKCSTNDFQQKLCHSDLNKHNDLATNVGCNTNRMLSKIVPSLEVLVVDPKAEIVVVNPNVLYSETENNEESDDSESEIDHPASVTSLESDGVLHVGPTTDSLTSDEPIQPVELIDGLFDSVICNIGEEDVLLDGNNQDFNLEAYITDQSESPKESSHASTPESVQNHSVHSQLAKPFDCKITADCKHFDAKNKREDDSSNLKRLKNGNETGDWCGIGRGKNFATLEKYYKENGGVGQSPVLRNANKNEAPMQQTSKNSRKEVNNNVDTSDFAKAIAASVARVPTRKPNVSKRANSKTQWQPSPLQERAFQFQKYLDERNVRRKMGSPSTIQKAPQSHAMVKELPKPNRVEPPEQRKTDIDNARANDQHEEPNAKRKISIQEYLQRRKNIDDSSPLNIESTAKRKISSEK